MPNAPSPDGGENFVLQEAPRIVGLSYEGRTDEIKNPSMLTPRKIFEFTSFLAALYAEKHIEATHAQLGRGELEAVLIAEGNTSASAHQIAAASDAGKLEIQLRSLLKSLEELIRALKKMGSFLSEESRNQY